MMIGDDGDDKDDDDDNDDNDDDNDDDDDDEEQKWHCGRLRGETWVKTQPPECSVEYTAVWKTLQCGIHLSASHLNP